ncbi:methyltransferase domain-containing protein [Georgenia sp. TF02-10]|uniref:putative RNA methyltransferase n=1 Tax=Georgenia sp. TF02-10 TaxID=2917725 RepID=UPI001FA6FEE3|nr:methyltransferase domain-containing protein [Georgenia sp. TF02-10]UNX55349.1 methyltransferase domain-containing protein [Georgenia sp. TF02-10]
MCRADLQPDRGALRCRSGHTFNVARQGYVSLVGGKGVTSGDDAAMARARDRFLATGSYARIRQTVVSSASEALAGKGTVIDIGCGTGYYLAGVLDRNPGAVGLGVDTSVRALRLAARAHERAAVASWDVFRPFPLADHVADIVLDVFAPRNPGEFHRILRPTGRLVVVRPTQRHLVELRERVPAMVTVDPAKEHRLRQALDPLFEVGRTEQVEYPASSLRHEEVIDLMAMTPSARHLSHTDLPDDASLPDRVTVSVLVTAYLPR